MLKPHCSNFRRIGVKFSDFYSSSYPIGNTVQIIKNLTFCKIRIFYQIEFFKSVVTLKIGTRSPKFNPVFYLSQLYKQSLVQNRKLVQEIGCKQCFWSKYDILSAYVTLKIGLGHQNLITSYPLPMM